jgi:uncharacterized protein (TIGR02246 family)
MFSKTLVISAALLVSGYAMAADKPAAAPAPLSATVAAPNQDEAGVKAAFERFSQAWAAGDAKARAMAFTEDATLINPFGMAASGRAEIEKLFEGENQTIAKGTQHVFSNFKINIVRPGLALVDADGAISGPKLPAQKLHIYAVAQLDAASGAWSLLAARPTIFASLPSAPAAPKK